MGNGWTVKKTGSSIIAEYKAGTDSIKPDVTIKWPSGFKVWVDKAGREKVERAVDDALRNNRAYVLTVKMWTITAYNLATSASDTAKAAALPFAAGGLLSPAFMDYVKVRTLRGGEKCGVCPDRQKSKSI